MLTRVPFPEVVLNPGDEFSHIAATRGDGYIMVYTPLGNDIELDGNLLPAPTYIAWWFDPRSGKSIKAATIQTKNRLRFMAPSRGPGFDWVLVLDEDGRNFTPPGVPLQAWQPINKLP